MNAATEDEWTRRLSRLFAEHPAWRQAARQLNGDASSNVYFHHQPGVPWHIVQKGTVEDLELLQAGNSNVIHTRSKDGRGILWWAYEYGRDDIIQWLIDEGIDEQAKDKEGFVASQLRELYSGK